MTLGWPTLDAATNGAMGGELVVIAGRPGMGKTYALIEMAHAAWLSGKSILFASMEMGLMQIARRWMGRLLGVNPNFIRAGQVSDWMAGAMAGAAEGEDALRVHLMYSANFERQFVLPKDPRSITANICTSSSSSTRVQITRPNSRHRFTSCCFVPWSSQ